MLRLSGYFCLLALAGGVLLWPGPSVKGRAQAPDPNLPASSCGNSTSGVHPHRNRRRVRGAQSLRGSRRRLPEISAHDCRGILEQDGHGLPIDVQLPTGRALCKESLKLNSGDPRVLNNLATLYGCRTRIRQGGSHIPAGAQVGPQLRSGIQKSWNEPDRRAQVRSWLERIRAGSGPRS